VFPPAQSQQSRGEGCSTNAWKRNQPAALRGCSGCIGDASAPAFRRQTSQVRTFSGNSPAHQFALYDVAWLGSLMPIYQLLRQQDRFAPEEIAVLGKIFEEILAAMGLADRKDLVTTIVAEKMIELANAGVRDPQRLKQLTVQAFEKD
jgi:hypothetical protein